MCQRVDDMAISTPIPLAVGWAQGSRQPSRDSGDGGAEFGSAFDMERALGIYVQHLTCPGVSTMTQECAFPSSDSRRSKYIKYLVFSAALGIVLTLTGCASSSPTAATSTAPRDSPATTPGTAGPQSLGDAAAFRPFATAWRQYLSEAKSQPDNAV